MLKNTLLKLKEISKGVTLMSKVNVILTLLITWVCVLFGNFTFQRYGFHVAWIPYFTILIFNLFTIGGIIEDVIIYRKKHLQ